MKKGFIYEVCPKEQFKTYSIYSSLDSDWWDDLSLRTRREITNWIIDKIKDRYEPHKIKH